ncbi:DUF4097 family beta strand repeat-containing protein [Kitasatospora sp. NPDC051853]|uniref:DUF4097 family beta strand repeat-containing protein n=1 Tax=Kitasatospora sp. NPDC051853 TaxID=3364058 RepID=UPI00378D0011
MKRVLVGAVAVAVVLGGAGGCSAVQEEREVGYAVDGPVRVLVVDSGTGDVRVSEEGSTVAVTERQEWRGEAPEARHELVDGTLTLTYRCPDGDCAVGYVVRVPAGTRVQVKAGTGSVRLAGLTGDVVADAGTGSVTAERLGSQRAELRAGTGDVRAGFAVAPARVRATAGTGSVRLELPKGQEYAVDAEAGTGEAKVEVPVRTASGHEVVARASTGDVTVSAG